MEAERSQVGDGLYMTVEQYLALDEATDGKYEYLDGYAFMLRPPSSAYDDQAKQAVLDMAGESVAHAALGARMAWVVGNALADSSSYTVYSDARVRLAERQYIFADLAVCCGKQAGAMLTNPVVVIEVLSPMTEQRDRGTKLEGYTALSSVQEYVLIGSEYQAIEVHRREGSLWRQYQYREGDLVELTSLAVSFPFNEVYPRTRL